MGLRPGCMPLHAACFHGRALQAGMLCKPVPMFLLGPPYFCPALRQCQPPAAGQPRPAHVVPL